MPDNDQTTVRPMKIGTGIHKWAGQHLREGLGHNASDEEVQDACITYLLAVGLIATDRAGANVSDYALTIVPVTPEEG